MTEANDRIQSLMDEVYTEWQKEENRGRDKWDILNGFTEAHQIAVLFGNFNYQVENGGIEQWIYNGYFHDDAEKLSEYLEAGAASDDRCQVILDKVNLLDKYAQDTECDRDGYYHDDEGDSRFIGDLTDCGKFDTWYYSRCGKDDWWETVCGIIDKAEGHEAQPAMRYEYDGEAAVPPLEVYIENADKEYIGGFTMPFPTTADALRPFLEGAEIGGWRDISIVDAFGEFAGKGDAVTEACRQSMSPDTLNELNYLAALISGMNEEGRNIFSAAMQAGWHCASLAELINLSHNSEAFYLQPAYNAEQYGKFMVEMDSDENLDFLMYLEQSGEQGKQDLAKYVRRLEASVDHKQYGRYYAEEEKGVFTDAGYITESGEYNDVYRGPEDIPVEYRVAPAWLPAPLATVKGADLAVLLAEMHATGGDACHQDLPHSLRQLADGSTDYFVMKKANMLHVIPLEELHRRNILGSEIVLGLEPSPDIHTYHLTVTGRENGNVTGNLYETKLSGVQDSLREYSFDFTYIDAEMRDGSRREISFAEWGERDLRERGEIQSFVFHYPPEDEACLRRHIANLRAAYEDKCIPISPVEFITRVNAPYLAGAKHPRPDMLRVSLPAAKEMLTHGDAPVYRMFPDGPTQLSPLDAMQSRGGLWYQEYREFAIRKTDFPGLEKWAKREAAALTLPQPERGETEKPKPRGRER